MTNRFLLALEIYKKKESGISITSRILLALEIFKKNKKKAVLVRLVEFY
jgi:hypothetical protein